MLRRRYAQQANAHHHSINGETIACLERSVKPQQFSTDDILLEARRLHEKAKEILSSEEIESAINQGARDCCQYECFWPLLASIRLNRTL